MMVLSVKLEKCSHKIKITTNISYNLNFTFKFVFN